LQSSHQKKVWLLKQPEWQEKQQEEVKNCQSKQRQGHQLQQWKEQQ